MNKKIINTLKYLLFLGIGLGILYYLYITTNAQYNQQRKLDGLPYEDYLIKLGNDFATANYFWLGMVVLAFLLSSLSRGFRWKMMLDPLNKSMGIDRRVRVKNTFFAVLVGYVVNLVIPRAGEVARCGVITQYEKISIDKVMGTGVLDRILDVLCLLIVMLLALVFEFDKLWGFISKNALPSGREGGGGLPTWMWIILGLGTLSLAAFIIFRKQIQATAIYKKIENLVLGFIEGLRSIQKLENPWAFIGHTVFIWVMYYLMLYLSFQAFEPTAHLSPRAGLLVFVFGTLGIVIPSPGGVGSYQFLVSTALITFYAIESSDALSFANIAFAAPFLCNIVMGVLAFMLLPIVNREKTE